MRLKFKQLLNLNGHFGVTNDSVHFLVIVRMPVGYLLPAAVVPAISYDFLHNEVLEGVPVIVGTAPEMVSAHR